MRHTRRITLAALALLGCFGPGVRGAFGQAPPNPGPAPALTTPAPSTVDPTPNGAVAAEASVAPAVGSAWYLEAEYMYLRRDVPRRTMSVDAGTLVTTKELHFNFEPGFRVGIGYQCSPTWALEASFFTTADWSSHKIFPASVTPSGVFAGSLFSGFSGFGVGPVAVSPFDGAQVNFLNYSARLEDLEFNLRHQVTANNNFVLNCLVGIRNVHTKEHFSLIASGTSDGLAVSAPVTGEYAVEANNDLFDFQAGGDLAYWLNDAFSVSGTAKMGYGWNHTRQRTAINNAFIGTLGAAGSTPFAVSAISEHIGGAGSLEYGLFANLRLGYGCSARVGYQAIFLTNMALAPRQVVFSTATNAQLNVDRNGTIFLHGPSAGIEFNW